MDISKKSLIIKYSIVLTIFVAVLLIIFALNLLQNYVKIDDFKVCIQEFFNESEQVPENYQNITIKSISEISDIFTNSYKKHLSSISFEAFFVKHNKGEFLLFIQPIFSDSGLVTAVFAFETNSKKMEYLGILENVSVKIYQAEILYAEKKLKAILELANK